MSRLAEGEKPWEKGRKRGVKTFIKLGQHLAAVKKETEQVSGYVPLTFHLITAESGLLLKPEKGGEMRIHQQQEAGCTQHWTE